MSYTDLPKVLTDLIEWMAMPLPHPVYGNPPPRKSFDMVDSFGVCEVLRTLPNWGGREWGTGNTVYCWKCGGFVNGVLQQCICLCEGGEDW